MLPVFPNFKKLELSDKADIEEISIQYGPYSDFNFETMWAWDIKDDAQISELNGNIVLIHSGHLSNETEYTYLGNMDVNDTLHHLFDFLDKLKIKKPQISVVPEVSLDGIDFNQYFIEIDLNSCDYIYDLQQLSSYAGNQYMQKRGRTNSFVRNYPNTEVKTLDLRSLEVRSEIVNLNNSWAENKHKNNDENDNVKELLAIERFMEANFENILCVGIYHGQLIGYAIFSFHRSDYVMNHFIKADIAYKGVYEFLMRESSVLLSGMGYEFLNFQEDMGLPGLRQAKMTYRPVKILRKYFVNRL